MLCVGEVSAVPLVSLLIGAAGGVVFPLGVSFRRVFWFTPGAGLGFMARTKLINHSQTRVLKRAGKVSSWRWPENVLPMPVCRVSRPIERSSPDRFEYRVNQRRLLLMAAS